MTSSSVSASGPSEWTPEAATVGALSRAPPNGPTPFVMEKPTTCLAARSRKTWSIGADLGAIGDADDVEPLDVQGPPSERDILTVHVALEHGDSGAAVVNGKGAVIGVAFAVVDDPAADTGLAIADSEVRAALAAVGGAPRVGTGTCL